MKKTIEILMDISLVLLFILVSSNYIESLPRYTPKTTATKSELAKIDKKANPNKTDTKSNLINIATFK